MSSTIKGTFKKNIYKSPQGYTIGLLKVKETTDEEVSDFISKTITFTGFFDDLIEDENYLFYGQEITHPKYGFQYEVSEYKKILPSDTDGIIEYLSSELFQGIGYTLASNIVTVLGNDALNKILNDKGCLTNIPKLSITKANMIYEVLKSNTTSHEDIVYLCELGFNMREALNIYNTYKTSTMMHLEVNPYSLIKDIKEITFPKIDSIAIKLNVKNDDLRRIKACIVYIMTELTYKKGDTYLEKEEIINEVNSYLHLNIEPCDYQEYFSSLADD